VAEAIAAVGKTSVHRFWTPEESGHVGSKKLDVPRHFFGGRNAAQEDQIEHDLPQPSVPRWPKGNPCVRPAGLGQHDEVTVARHQHAALRMSELQLLQVGGASEFLLDGGCHINPPQSQASGNSGVDVLIEVVFDFRHPLRSISPTTAAGQEPGTCFRLQLCCNLGIIPDLLVDQTSVVVVIRQGRVHVGERQVRKRPHNLVGRPPLLGPENDVLDTDSRARNPRLPSAGAWVRFDVGFFRSSRHERILERRRFTRKIENENRERDRHPVTQGCSFATDTPLFRAGRG